MTSTGVVLVVLVVALFGGPRGGFLTNLRSGLPLRTLLSKPPLGPPKPLPRPPGPPRDSSLPPLVRLLTVLKYPKKNKKSKRVFLSAF